MKKYKYYIARILDPAGRATDAPKIKHLQQVEGYLVDTGFGTIPICVRKKENGYWTADAIETGYNVDGKAFKSRKQAVDHVLSISDKINKYAHEDRTYRKLAEQFEEACKAAKVVGLI